MDLVIQIFWRRGKKEKHLGKENIFLGIVLLLLTWHFLFFAFQNIKKKKIASLRHNHNVPTEYGCSTISTPSLSSVVGSPKKLWVQKKQEGRAQLVRIAGSKQTSREPDKEKATAAALLTAHCCSVMNSSAQARCSVTKSTVGHLPAPF